MRKTMIACALLFALPMTAPAAEICDQIETAANGWAALSTLIDSSEADGLSEEEAAQIGASVAQLTEGSATLAGMLQGGGNADQVALGEELEKVLSEFASLDGDADVEYAVSVIDEVTAAMSAVTDDCNAAHE